MSSSWERMLMHPLAAPVIYLVATVLFTWPLATNPGDLFVDGQFQWSQVWSTWLLQQSIESRAGFTAHTSLACFPQGGDIILIGASHHVIALLLNRVLPLVTAFNIAVLIHLWAAPYAAYLLYRRLTGSAVGALAGGMVFGFSHHILIAVALGQIHESSHVWIALFLLALVFCLDGLSALRLLGMALVTAGLLFSTPQGALATCLLAPGIALVYLVRGRFSHRLLLRLVAVASVCLPVAILAYQYLHGCDNDLMDAPLNVSLLEESSGVRLSLGRFWNRDLAFPMVNASSMRVINTGTLALVLGAASLLGPARRRAACWWGVWGMFVLLAFGKTATISGYTIRLPLWYLSSLFPIFLWIKFSWRFMIIVFLALGILVSWGLPQVLQRLPPRARTPAAGFLTTALFLLVLQPGSDGSYPLPITRLRIPQVYHDLAASGVGAIIEYPVELGLARDYESLNDLTMFYQIFHGRPVAQAPKNNLARCPTYRTPFMVTLSDVCLTGRCEVTPAAREGLDELMQWRFTDFILHEGALPDGARQAVRGFLDELLPVRREYPSDGIVWYAVRQKSGSPGQ